MNNNYQYGQNNRDIGVKVKRQDVKENNLDFAERIFQEYENKKCISSNQLRNLLNLFITVRNSFEKSEEINLSEEELYKVKYIKVKMYYQAAKAGNVDKEFIENCMLAEKLENVKTRKDYYKLVEYVEALVAFHKYYIKEKGNR